MELIKGKICNDMPIELYEQIKKINFSKITDKEYNELLGIYNDFRMLIPLKKQIILSEKELYAPENIIKLLNSIDYSKSNKNIIKIAINYLQKNVK